MPEVTTIPASITTDSFASAMNSLYYLRAWLLADEHRKVKITFSVLPTEAGIATYEYDNVQDALNRIDAILAQIQDENIPVPVYFVLVYQDMTIAPIHNEPPVPKELSESLKTIITTSSSDLTTFANALYSWSTTGGTGCVTAVCQLSPPQSGFANTFNAPDLNSLVSWISSVESYMAGGGTYTAAIVVTSVVCGSTGFGEE